MQVILVANSKAGRTGGARSGAMATVTRLAATMTLSAPIPVNVVTGFLGVGKTTAIRHLLAHKPADEYWAIVVNEFGEIGIDGASLSDDGSAQLQIAEVPGGCLCCTTSPLLRVTLTRLIRTRRPDRILIEPSGLGHPSGIFELLAEPLLAKVLQIRATLTLVDPRHWFDSRYTLHETWRDQVQLADVLVLNHCDRADAEQIDRVLAAGRALYPPKLAVHSTSHGRIDLAWLDLDPDAARRNAVPVPLAHRRLGRPLPPDGKATAADTDGIVQKQHIANGHASGGWILPPDLLFDAEAISAFLARLDEAAPFGLPPLVRAKGVLHTTRGWFLLNWIAGQADAAPCAWRRDSRFELICASDSAPDWQATADALFACLCEPRPRPSNAA